MHTLDDTVDALCEAGPAPIRDALAALADAPRDMWSASLLGDLPGHLAEASVLEVPETITDRFRHAHQLGLLFGWLSEAPEDPGEDPRLRGFVLGRWKACLSEATGLSPAKVVDRVVHTMRWMRWGLTNEAMATRAQRWTLPEYHRALQWRAAGRALASAGFIRRVVPAKIGAFDRIYEQIVLGLAQTSVSPHSALPRLLGCASEDLRRSGLLALEMAQIEARAAGLDALAELCRDHARLLEPGSDARRSEVRAKLVTTPDTPELLRRRDRTGGQGS